MIFPNRRKCREEQILLGIIFYNLEKAVDKISYIADPRTLWMGREIHHPNPTRGNDGSCPNFSIPFPFLPQGNWKKKGCVLAPIHFSIFLAALLHEISDDNLVIDLQYRTDSGSFNISRFRSRTQQTHESQSTVPWPMNPGPWTLAHELEGFQNSTDTTPSRAYIHFGFNINVAIINVVL